MSVYCAIKRYGSPVLAVLVSGLALSACLSERERELMATLPCPDVGIVRGTERITLYEGDGRDVTDQIVHAEIDKAVTDCEYDLGDGIIYVDVAYSGTAELGPAAASREITLPAFIALTETSRKILRKETRPLTLRFEGNTRKITFEQDIKRNKVPYVPPFDGAAYEMLVGFQLSREQLRQNREDDRQR